jgi:hypothetical protein
VIEETPTGLQVRDAGSANGVFVNGRKTERSPLVAFDLVRLGEVIVKVLPGDPPSTVVMAPEDLLELGAARGTSLGGGPSVLGTEPRPVPGAPSRRAPAPPSSRPGMAAVPRPAHSANAGRPTTLTTLASLWAASVLIYGASAVLSPFLGLRDTAGTAHAAGSALMALVSAVMAFGLFTRKPWARLAQAGIAGLGLLLCPFTLASATALIYVLRPSTKAFFEGKATDDPAETTFTLTLVGTVVLGVLLTAASLFSARVLG